MAVFNKNDDKSNGGKAAHPRVGVVPVEADDVEEGAAPEPQ